MLGSDRVTWSLATAGNGDFAPIRMPGRACPGGRTGPSLSEACLPGPVVEWRSVCACGDERGEEGVMGCARGAGEAFACLPRTAQAGRRSIGT
jgi:hypothetical protein